MVHSSTHRNTVKKKSAGHTDRNSATTRTPSPIALLRSIALGLICTIGIGLLFLWIAAFAAHASSDPIALVKPLALTATYAAALFSGMITVRIYGRAPLVCGALAALSWILAGCLIGLCLPSSEAFSLGEAVLTRLPIPPLAIFGAYIALKREKPAHRHRHR